MIGGTTHHLKYFGVSSKIAPQIIKLKILIHKISAQTPTDCCNIKNKFKAKKREIVCKKLFYVPNESVQKYEC